MKILLDTHLILWGLLDQRRLPDEARAMIEDWHNEVVFSVASLWEVGVKGASGKKDFYAEPRILREAMLSSDYTELAISGEHVLAVRNLPLIHKDPFDRILIAQAMVEGIVLLTSDAVVARYSGPIRLVKANR